LFKKSKSNKKGKEDFRKRFISLLLLEVFEFLIRMAQVNLAPGEVAPGEQQPLRGFTTAQLLHLAAQITQNKIYQPETQVKIKGGGGATEAKHVVRKNLRDDLAAQFPGIQLPDRVGTHAVKDLVKVGWILNGREQNAFGPANAAGQSLEQFRGALYDYAVQNFTWLADQRLWPQTRNPRTGQVGYSSGSSLDELFGASGYHINGQDPRNPGKNYRKPDTFEERIQGVATLLRATNRNQAPGAGVRSARGAVFQRAPASAQQLVAIINGGQYGGKQYGGINGFVASKFADFLAKRVTVPVANESLQVIKDTHADYVGRRAPILAGGPGTSTELRDAIRALGNNPALLYQRFRAAFQGVPDAQVSEYLWSLTGKSGLNELLSGYKISKPYTGAVDAAGKQVRMWLHDIPAQSNQNGDDALGYSRFVFDTLLATYIARGGNGDANVDPSSTRNREQGPKGILGVNDKSIQSLGWDTAKGRQNLASFIRKAKQNQYSMPALLEGARRLGVQVPENATLHESVIVALREAVIQRLDGPARQGDALAIKAVAAALGITKADVSAADLIRKVDAMYGRKTTAQCDADTYTREDQKRIAKANNIALKDLTSTAEGCAALAGVPVVQASAQISGRRQENETQPAASSSRRREAGGAPLIQQLAAAQLPAYTPGTLAGFGNLLGSVAQQPMQQPNQALSGGRSSGRAGGQYISRGATQQVVNPATGRVLSGTRGTHAQSGLGLGAQTGNQAGGAGRLSGGLNQRQSGGRANNGLPNLPNLPGVGQTNNGAIGGSSLADLAARYANRG